jgi:hypothetical protein
MNESIQDGAHIFPDLTLLAFAARVFSCPASRRNCDRVRTFDLGRSGRVIDKDSVPPSPF